MTIEQRANELYCDADGYVKSYEDDFMRLGYIKGAEEMLDKACKWLYSHCNGTMYVLLGSAMHPANDFVDEFRKEMEGEHDTI